MFRYRHEYKYVCRETTLAVVQGRIGSIMLPDPHARGEGSYQIRSLYFDDAYGSCFRENENGTDPREKFRIRIYNGSAAHISLELKQKRRGMTRKLACPLTEEQCRVLMNGGVLPMEPTQAPLLQKLLLLMETRLFRPAVIVEYTRTPYIYPCGNVRVTLDKNISASTAFSAFLEPEIPRRPVMATGTHILEVKFDEFLPDPIHSALQMDGLRHSSFSKFYLCQQQRL